uniref:Uncharacterized protein n=1 Tax=Trichogramma kaykai TaxID=54128 RepID=A0ABD2WBL1_9HYME
MRADTLAAATAHSAPQLPQFERRTNGGNDSAEKYRDQSLPNRPRSARKLAVILRVPYRDTLLYYTMLLGEQLLNDREVSLYKRE